MEHQIIERRQRKKFLLPFLLLFAMAAAAQVNPAKDIVGHYRYPHQKVKRCLFGLKIPQVTLSPKLKRQCGKK